LHLTFCLLYSWKIASSNPNTFLYESDDWSSLTWAMEIPCSSDNQSTHICIRSSWKQNTLTW
jgi:hypothetical protein